MQHDMSLHCIAPAAKQGPKGYVPEWEDSNKSGNPIHPTAGQRSQPRYSTVQRPLLHVQAAHDA